MHREKIVCRLFQLTLNSANNLENVRQHFDMRVYAEVTLAGNSGTKRRTSSDRAGGINPVWNQTMKYTVSESAVQCDGVMVVIQLYCARKLGDKYIGQVSMTMKQLFNHAQPLGGSAEVSFPVTKGGVVSQGMLKFSYCFGETALVKKTPEWMTELKYGAAILFKVAAVVTVSVYGGHGHVEIPNFKETDLIVEPPPNN